MSSRQDFCAEAREVRPRSQPVEVYGARPYESYLRAAGAAFSIFSRPFAIPSVRSWPSRPIDLLLARCHVYQVSRFISSS